MLSAELGGVDSSSAGLEAGLDNAFGLNRPDGGAGVKRTAAANPAAARNVKKGRLGLES